MCGKRACKDTAEEKEKRKRHQSGSDPRKFLSSCTIEYSIFTICTD
jgi:hypothetical protein